MSFHLLPLRLLAPLLLILGSVLVVLPTTTATGRGATCFAETGFCVQGRFLDYWRAHGGLVRHGFPTSGEFTQTLEDGKPYTVQYFERARLEWHPQNPAPNDVLLGQLGRRIYSEVTPRVLAFVPATGPCATANPEVSVRGSGFTPGVVTRFILRRDRDGAITAANSTSGGLPANADGTYVNDRFSLVGCGPDEPVGSTFTIMVTEYRPDQLPVNGPSVQAVFTVTAPQAVMVGRR